MDPDFVVWVKCTIFCLNRGLSVYLGLYAPDFPKNTSKYLFDISSFLYKPPYLWGDFGLKATQIMLNLLLQKKVRFCQKYIEILI